MNEITTNEEMLNKMSEERPHDTIHEVLSFEKNKFGFYNVLVDIQSSFFGCLVEHTKMTLAYPFAEFNKLSEEEKKEWRTL